MRIEGPFLHTSSLPQSDSYTTKAGDTLQSIGQQFGVSARHLADANKLDVKQALTAGIQLLIPKGSSPTPHQSGISNHKDQFEHHKPGALDSMLNPQTTTVNQQQPNIGSIGEISPLPTSSLGEIMIKPGIASELLPSKPAVLFELLPSKPSLASEIMPSVNGEILSPEPSVNFEMLPAEPAVAGEIMGTKPLPGDVGELLPGKNIDLQKKPQEG